MQVAIRGPRGQVGSKHSRCHSQEGPGAVLTTHESCPKPDVHYGHHVFRCLKSCQIFRSLLNQIFNGSLFRVAHKSFSYVVHGGLTEAARLGVNMCPSACVRGALGMLPLFQSSGSWETGGAGPPSDCWNMKGSRV